MALHRPLITLVASFVATLAGCTGYKYGNQVYDSTYAALEAANREQSGFASQISPYSSGELRIGGSAAVFYPTTGVLIMKGVSEITDAGDIIFEKARPDVTNYVASILEISFRALASALAKSHLFDNVTTIPKHNFNAPTQDEADYTIWFADNFNWYVKSRSNPSRYLVKGDWKMRGGAYFAEWLEGVRTAALESTRGEKPFANTVPPERESDQRVSSSGTGFIVNERGDVLTNLHVVEGCTSLAIAVNGKKKNLSLRASDQRLDLAALAQEGWQYGHATFRGGRGIRSGDSIVILGYPLRGLLASGLNLSTGTISALAGVGNESSRMQISAPVQPGNSGGPVIDENGNVVGIVVSKIDAVQVASAIGDIPQNINFAIKATAARDFLDANDIGYTMSGSGGALSAADIGEMGKDFTVPIECLN